MANQDIRLEAAGAGVRLWQIAERMGIADCNFSRILRKELTTEQKVEMRRIITELKEGV